MTIRVRSIRVDPTDPDQLLPLNLPDGRFVFRLTWNGRMRSWFLSVYDSARQPLVTGIRLTIGDDLLHQYQARATLPRGILLAVALEDRSPYGYHPATQIERDQLGQAVRLLYILPPGFSVAAVGGVITGGGAPGHAQVTV